MRSKPKHKCKCAEKGENGKYNCFKRSGGKWTHPDGEKTVHACLNHWRNYALAGWRLNR